MWKSVLALVAGAATVYLMDKVTVEPLPPKQMFKVVDIVEQKSWQLGIHVPDLIAAGREPVLITGEASEYWYKLAGALNHADGSEYLRPSTVPNVRVSEYPVFFGANEKPSQVGSDINRLDDYDTVLETSGDGFFRRASDSTFLYASVPLDEFDAKFLQVLDTSALEALVVGSTGEFAERYGFDALDATASAWLGTDGVITQMHYDRSHNFVVQLSGEKQWILIPPTEHQHAYLYPELHPHYHQSQVNVLEPDFNKFPLARDLESYVVTMRPGDLMYIPPCWLHTVKAVVHYEEGDATVLEVENEMFTAKMYDAERDHRHSPPSMSLSVITPSEEEILYTRALADAKEWLSEASDDPVLAGSCKPTDDCDYQPSLELALQLRRFFDVLYHVTVHGEDTAADVTDWGKETNNEGLVYIRAVLRENRYKYFMDSLVAAANPKLHEVWRDHCSSSPLSQSSSYSKAEEKALAASSLFLTMPAQPMGVLLSSFIEEVLAHSLGSKNVPLFLEDCL